MKQPKYIPALSFNWLTPIYDPLLKWGMREEIFKSVLLHQAQFRPGMQVLDLGCGTATLTILIKKTYPEVEVIGLDGDQTLLEIARAKSAQAGVAIKLDQGMAYDLPYLDSSFDRVISSLVIHHLVKEDKQRAMQEAFRVLRSGGELHIVDFGKPRGVYAHLDSILMRSPQVPFRRYAPYCSLKHRQYGAFCS